LLNVFLVSQLLAQLPMKIQIIWIPILFPIVLFDESIAILWYCSMISTVIFIFISVTCYQHELFLHKLHERERTIHIDELCNAGYVINRDAFTETLINATIPAVLWPRKGFWNKAPKKNVELNARVGEWRDTDVYIYAQCTGLSSGPFESTRTSRLDDREEIEICDDCADEISVSLNGGSGPSRAE